MYVCLMKLLIILLLFAATGHLAGAQTKIKFTKADSLKLTFCNCDSIYKNWGPKPKPNSEIPEFEGKGWNRLYNFQNNIGQCGYFHKFYFAYGLQFKYDPNGQLIKINKFYNEKLIGVCDLKKK